MRMKYEITKQSDQLTLDQKKKFFGEGEWVQEPDLFEIEYLGYKCRFIRMGMREPCCPEETYFGGYLCVYVRIPEDHVLFGQKDIEMECHGGITFNEVRDDHWIGFDCAHSCDFVPSIELTKRKGIESGELSPSRIPEECKRFAIFHPVYRNMKYCIGECVKIVDQLITIDAESIK